MNKKELRGVEEKDKKNKKKMKNTVQIPFIFKKETIFYRSGGIEPGIENAF